MKGESPKAAVFLDRDGVINRATVRGDIPHPPGNIDEVEILPGVREALQKLSEAGLPLIVVTNQPDVARGTQKREVVEGINALLMKELPLTATYTCYHDNADACGCRKPKSGLLKEAASQHNLDLSQSYMVGDRWSDIAAGQDAGCETFLINLPYSQCDRCTPDHQVADLLEASEIILSRMRSAEASRGKSARSVQ